MKKLSKEELRQIAWSNAIKNGSYGYNEGKFFLLFPDGRVSEPLDSSNIENEGWKGNIAHVGYENAFDYDDLSDYAEELGKSPDDLTDAEIDQFIENVADNPPDRFELEDPHEYDYMFEDNDCPRGYHMVKGYKKRDGSYIKGHCAKDPKRW